MEMLIRDIKHYLDYCKENNVDNPNWGIKHILDVRLSNPRHKYSKEEVKQTFIQEGLSKFLPVLELSGCVEE